MHLLRESSVSNVVKTLVGLLGLVVLIVATIDLKKSFDYHRAAVLMEKQNALAEACLDGVKNFAFERGRSNVILRGADPISAQNNQFITERRLHTDKAIASILQAVHRPLNTNTDEIEKAWVAVQALRISVDQDFALPLPNRDPSLPARWFSAASELLDKLEAAMIAASHVPGADNMFERLASVRVLAMQFRKVVGTESAKLASELSGKRIPKPETIADIQHLRGQSIQLWLQLEQEAEYLNTPAFKPALAQIKALFLGQLRPLQDEMLRNYLAGTPSDLSIERYTNTSVPALDSVINALDSINLATHQFTRDHEQLARNLMITASLAIFCTLLLLWFSFKIMARRVSDPLSRIAQRIDKLSGQNNKPEPVAVDELVKVDRALDLLEELLNSLNRDAEILREAKLTAESANRAKSQFLATMSHEIRTPLNGVLGMAQLLQMPGLEEQERIDYANTIVKSGRILLLILNDLLDLSKIEAGKLELHETPFEIDQLVDDTTHLFSDLAAEKGLLLTSKSGTQRHLHYHGDPLRLRQMISNLLSNAIKFTAKGSVLLEVRALEQNNQDVLLEFSVTDTGIGIAPEKTSLLFQPFTQADSSTTREYGGTGLGLSIILSFAKLMNGNAGVDSEVGKGSKFWFTCRLTTVA